MPCSNCSCWFCSKGGLTVHSYGWSSNNLQGLVLLTHPVPSLWVAFQTALWQSKEWVAGKDGNPGDCQWGSVYCRTAGFGSSSSWFFFQSRKSHNAQMWCNWRAQTSMKIGVCSSTLSLLIITWPLHGSQCAGQEVCVCVHALNFPLWIGCVSLLLMLFVQHWTVTMLFITSRMLVAWE